MEKELDLVEVAPQAVPPVCRIMNAGKFFYEQNKREAEARKHQKHIQIKEVKFRPKVDDHDFDFKKRNVERFLAEGNKVKSLVQFRGREIVHSFGQTAIGEVRGAIRPTSEKLAAYVDEEMKDVSRASGAVDSVKIAVLAALNLADECFRLRQEADSKHSSGAAVDERALRLARKLGAALGE